MLDRLSDGIILGPPSGCPKKVYKLMVECWNPCKDTRPTFNHIVANLAINEDSFLDRGSSPSEQMEMGLPPAATQEMFKDIQLSYAPV